jgi:hypothetical protein
MKTAALLIASSFTFAAAPAYAGPCSKEIEIVTQLMSGGGSASTLGTAASAVLSSGAEEAAPATDPKALFALQEAKKADAAGDEPTCMEYITQAKELLGVIK